MVEDTADCRSAKGEHERLKVDHFVAQRETASYYLKALGRTASTAVHPRRSPFVYVVSMCHVGPAPTTLRIA